MPNMSLKKNEMPSQEPQVRNKNFLEVALGYTEEQALDEAQRCLHCKNKPCVSGCPVGINLSLIHILRASRDRLPVNLNGSAGVLHPSDGGILHQHLVCLWAIPGCKGELPPPHRAGEGRQTL